MERAAQPAHMPYNVERVVRADRIQLYEKPPAIYRLEGDRSSLAADRTADQNANWLLQQAVTGAEARCPAPQLQALLRRLGDACGGLTQVVGRGRSPGGPRHLAGHGPGNQQSPSNGSRPWLWPASPAFWRRGAGRASQWLHSPLCCPLRVAPWSVSFSASGLGQLDGRLSGLLCCCSCCRLAAERPRPHSNQPATTATSTPSGIARQRSGCRPAAPGAERG